MFRRRRCDRRASPRLAVGLARRTNRGGAPAIPRGSVRSWLEPHVHDRSDPVGPGLPHGYQTRCAAHESGRVDRGHGTAGAQAEPVPHRHAPVAVGRRLRRPWPLSRGRAELSVADARRAAIAQALPRLAGVQIIFLFIEQDQRRVDHLRSEVAALGALPGNVTVRIEHGAFEATFGGLLDQATGHGKTLVRERCLDPLGLVRARRVVGVDDVVSKSLWPIISCSVRIGTPWAAMRVPNVCADRGSAPRGLRLCAARP